MRQIERGDDPWAGSAPDDPDRLQGEEEILRCSRTSAPSRAASPSPEEVSGERVRAPEEHLLTCLRTYETGGEGLPPVFLDRLLGVLRRHGIDGLGPSTEVEDALLRLYRSSSGSTSWSRPSPPSSIAGSPTAASWSALAGDDLRGLLDHLVATTEGRYPALMDLARDVRFRFFDQPLLARAQAERYADMDRHIDALAAGTEPGARVRHMDALIACPQPMRPALLRRYQHGDPPERDVVLEAAARRYYRIRDLADLALVDADGVRLAVADYPHAGNRCHLMVAFGAADTLPAIVRAVAGHLAQVPSELQPILDVHLWQAGEPGDVDAVAAELRGALAPAGFGRPMHRVDVTITAEPPDPRPPVTYHYCFRPGADGLVEDPLYRNMHPMLAKRLNLDRLRRFAITRLDSAEDVYLFHGVARDNPKDERLFALAEVRDLTPVRDDAGTWSGSPCSNGS